jgi:hypothetical protein
MVVCIDRGSGSLWCAAVAAQRPSDPWAALGETRGETVGTDGLSLGSARAKARRKLAATGRGGLRIPEVFPLLPALVTRSSLALLGRLRPARQAVRQAQERLRRCQGSAPGGAQAPQAQAVVEARAAQGPHGEPVDRASRQHRARGLRLVQPGRLFAAPRQTSHAVARQLPAEIAALAGGVDTPGGPVKKQAVDQGRPPLPGVCAVVDFWWQGVCRAVQHMARTPMWRRGIAAGLLPLRDGPQQAARTRCPRRTATRLQAVKALQAAGETPPMTQPLAPGVLADWPAWAAERAQTVPRASSAVEGRNGSLAQRHHTPRGFPQRRSKVWTVLQTFDCCAPDGPTPAARFFRRSFPDLFETGCSPGGDLPRPRKRHQAMALCD